MATNPTSSPPVAQPTTRSIREGLDEDFLPGQNPFQPGSASFDEGLRAAQSHYDRYGNLPADNWKGIRIENGRAVDDRSWWSKNNWWALPAAVVGGAAAFPLLAGGGGAAASGAGSSGLIPSHSLSAASLMGGPPAISSGGAGASIASLMSGAAPEWTVSSVANPASGWSSGVAGATRNPVGAVTMNRFSDPNTWADISSLLDGFTDTERANRMTSAGQISNWDQLMLQAQRDRSGVESDALSKLATTNYLRSGGSTYKPTSIDFMGGKRELPQFGFGPRGASQEQIAGATDLEQQLLKRLQPGGTFTPTNHEQYSRPGVAEQVGRWGSTGAGVVGLLKKIFG